MPLAERVEARVRPAIREFGQSLHDFQRQIFGGVRGPGGLERDAEYIGDEGGVSPSSSSGGDYHTNIEQLFSQAMDPFRIFR